MPLTKSWLSEGFVLWMRLDRFAVAVVLCPDKLSEHAYLVTLFARDLRRFAPRNDASLQMHARFVDGRLP
jgi:hypothetical protein